MNEITNNEIHGGISFDGFLRMIISLNFSHRTWWFCKHFVVVTQTMDSVTVANGGVICRPRSKCRFLGLLCVYECTREKLLNSPYFRVYTLDS